MRFASASARSLRISSLHLRSVLTFSGFDLGHAHQDRAECTVMTSLTLRLASASKAASATAGSANLALVERAERHVGHGLAVGRDDLLEGRVRPSATARRLSAAACVLEHQLLDRTRLRRRVDAPCSFRSPRRTCSSAIDVGSEMSAGSSLT